VQAAQGYDRARLGQALLTDGTGKRGDSVPDGGGTVGFYEVQIESLEQFQQQLTLILESLESDNTVMGLSDASGTFGDFPEAQSFSAAYETAKQNLIATFAEVTQLVNTMISVVGANAGKYKQTEQDITARFNAILGQYGDAPFPTPTAATTAGYGASYAASAPTGSTGTSTGSGTGTSTGQGAGTTYATQSSAPPGPPPGGSNTSAGAE
jgi:hypothetical protein